MADYSTEELEKIADKFRSDTSGIRGTKDFTSPEELYDELKKEIKKYHPSDDTSLVDKAYRVAYDAHKGQARKSGEPYIIHPLCVAIILAELELDKETIAAGLLHDVLEDTIMTMDEMRAEFGDDVAHLVDGVTKLKHLHLTDSTKDPKDKNADRLEMQAENLRKMFLAMAKDIRVILIKLADRLHNMRTLKYQSKEAQQRIARETQDIYCPIAQRLGISKIKIELEDLCMKYLYPDAYYDLVEKVALRKTERDTYIQGLVNDVKKYVSDAGIKAEIYGRAKHFFSIYKKMVNQHKTIDQIYDLFAVRIKVDTVKDCYAALGIIHEMYKPIPGRFKDYIAMPKPNMYQSLHTTLIGPGGRPFEIQIRTYEMHRTAEYGIAAHWKYKEGGGSEDEGELEKWLKQSFYPYFYVNSTSFGEFDAFDVENYADVMGEDKVEAIRENISDYWGIHDRKSLMKTTDSLLQKGDKYTYAQTLEKLGEEELTLPEDSIYYTYKLYAPDEMCKYLGTYYAYNNIGDAGVDAWDYCRCIRLFAFGYICGYISYDEYLIHAAPLAVYLQNEYDSWETMYESYYYGYLIFAGRNKNSSSSVIYSDYRYYEIMADKTEIPFRTEER